MERLLSTFSTREKLRAIVAGAPLDLAKCNRKENVITILLHCCINGPVSPHKVTTYPLVGETSLDEEAGFRISNGSLKATCLKIAEWLETQDFHEGSRQELYGKFWPSYL